MSAKIVLSSEKLGVFKAGHPWIYPKAILSQKSCKNGELVKIFDEEEQYLGTGMYNANSLYRVRVLAYAEENIEQSSLESIIDYRFKQAMHLRAMLALEENKTTAFRFFNSEADGLSGLTIDCFNQVLVVSSSAFWVEKNRTLITACLKTCCPDFEVIWFPQTNALKQEGFLIEPSAVSDYPTTKVLEAGIEFEINFSNAQKTGLFLDQRDNHQRIAALAKGKRVLDLYTYTGGFALHASKHGAAHVTAIDSSEAAIAQAQRNATLNGLETIDFIKDDARNFLSRAGEYDIVVLDPPKLIPSKRNLHAAKNYYRFLHREVFKAMKPGSLLMTCNCSSAIDAAEFNLLVHTQARIMHKTVRTLGIYGPSLCHPTLAIFPEGHYLCAILLAIV